MSGIWGSVRTELSEDPCGKPRRVDLGIAGALEVTCIKHRSHTKTPSRWLGPHYWAGTINGAFMTISWRD